MWRPKAACHHRALARSRWAPVHASPYYASDEDLYQWSVRELGRWLAARLAWLDRAMAEAAAEAAAEARGAGGGAAGGEAGGGAAGGEAGGGAGGAGAEGEAWLRRVMDAAVVLADAAAAGAEAAASAGGVGPGNGSAVATNGASAPASGVVVGGPASWLERLRVSASG